MRVPTCPLIVGLTLFASCILSPMSTAGQTSAVNAQSTGAIRNPRRPGRRPPGKQSPSMVNIRPRVTSPQPGLPTVKVTVDRKRVPLGDEVTFTLAPASVVLDSHYVITIYFGDGIQQRVRQTEIVYLYRATGTYTYSILVKPSDTIPRVTLAASPTRVATERPVTFTAQLSQSYPNIRYRFFFGDGNQTEWQDAPRTMHSYRSANTYLAYVDIGPPSGSGVNRLGGSPRQSVQVIASRPVAVTLTANPTSVEVKQRAVFVARADPTEPNIKYRFDFGDRSGVTAWQASPRTAHTYSSAGTYPARVDIQVQGIRSGPQTASSKPLSMEVRSPAQRPPPRPTPAPPIASPTIPSPSPTASPTIPSPSPTASPTATPTTNSPLDGGSSDDWWKYLLLVLILFAGYQGWKALHAPRPTLVPKVDPGDSQLGHKSGPLGINFQMELNPNLTDGQVAVNTDGGSLIKSERKSDG
jgi:PKD domain